ncbi:cache domain-containing sensor histidine kinase [Paenibacillus sp. GXUN7292]|uniref:cache domain-containing sensor histidine kinase n=1 Tax=Paenibacillus sp. GXUN7292 TaxID=3422499 RepID=UPI003D7DD961
MSRLVTLLRLNRTRVQILLGFLTVIAIVLSIAGGYLYRTLSDQLVREAEQYVGATAEQASARLDAVFAQVDALTLQLITDPRIQDLLYKVHVGEAVSIEDKLSVRPILYHLMAFSWQIESIELYAGEDPFYPLENQNFLIRIGQEAATFANLREGQLVWTSNRHKDEKHLLAVRQIRLQQDYLAAGGYVIVKISDALLSFFHTEFSAFKGGTMYLYDQRGKLVAASSQALLDAEQLQKLAVQTTAGQSGEAAVSSPIVRINNTDYLQIIRQSNETNWSILMLVPLTAITGGLLVLKKAIIFAVSVSIIICLLLVGALSSLITKPIIKLRSKMRSTLSTLPEPNNEHYFNFEMNELNLSYNKLVQELHDMVETVYEKERLKNQAEIKMLQAQIHPHFLFNTLESLHWMLVEKKETDGARMVIALSRLFRYSIRSTSNDDWTTLDDELNHCRMYLEIMGYRLGPRLSWQVHSEQMLHTLALPKLMLQPLVENAIAHGIEPRVEGGHIAINALPVHIHGKAHVRIEINDNGLGMKLDALSELRSRLQAESAAHAQTPGLGLLNVQHRLKLYFGTNYSLQLKSSPGEGMHIAMIIPIRS